MATEASMYFSIPAGAQDESVFCASAEVASPTYVASLRDHCLRETRVHHVSCHRLVSFVADVYLDCHRAQLHRMSTPSSRVHPCYALLDSFLAVLHLPVLDFPPLLFVHSAGP